MTYSSLQVDKYLTKHPCTNIHMLAPSQPQFNCSPHALRSKPSLYLEYSGGQSALRVVHSIYLQYSWGQPAPLRVHSIYPTILLGKICSPYGRLCISYNTAGDNMISLIIVHSLYPIIQLGTISGLLTVHPFYP